MIRMLQKKPQRPFFYSSFYPKDSFPLLLFYIVSFIEVYSIKTLLLNKIRKKVFDGIEKKAPYLIILLSYIKTTYLNFLFIPRQALNPLGQRLILKTSGSFGVISLGRRWTRVKRKGLSPFLLEES